MAQLLYFKENKVLKWISDNDIIDELYEARARLPTIEDIESYIKKGNNQEIINYIKNDTPQNIIKQIKESISKIDNKIPLYDAYKRNLFIISKENVFNRVIKMSYRFPDKYLLNYINDKKQEYGKLDFDPSNLSYKIISQKSEYEKILLMDNFLSSFDLDILEKTYTSVMYYSASEVGKNITTCKKPSFTSYFTHIEPYYTRSELINLALNMEIIRPNNKYYDRDDIDKLCKIVIKNDISYEIIIDHQKHIIDNDSIGLVQYYSLHGSYYMNNYLRRMTPKNELLETLIINMWKLIKNAPAFDKEYTLYRFVSNDPHLKDLKVGDIYLDPSFISTTRDPFYKPDSYKFGFILIKIKIPANIKGIALCIEPYSHFQKEQEIIFPPLSKLRLDRKDDNASYYHIDEDFSAKVLTRYEFTYMGNNNVHIEPRLEPTPIKDVDFMKIDIGETYTIQEKIKRFVSEYTNENFQFQTKIGETYYTINAETYDSTTAYRRFYAYTTNEGFSFYTFIDNYILFVIEIAESNGVLLMYVNYYFKLAAANRSNKVKDNDFMDFLAKIGYFFGVQNIIIYSDYSSCDISGLNEDDKKIDYYGGNYCIDFYNYINKKEKRFKNNNTDIPEIIPQFSYYELDRLRVTEPSVILNRGDRDEVYQIYKQIYIKTVDKTKNNIADFYLWLVKNYCVYLDYFVNKMGRLFERTNPFSQDFYIMDANRYLYNRGMTNVLMSSSVSTLSTVPTQLPKNVYRLDMYKKKRVPARTK